MKRAQGIDICPLYQKDYEDQPKHSFLMPQVSNGLTIWYDRGLPYETRNVEFIIPYHYLRSGWSWIAQYDRFVKGCEIYKPDGFMVDFEKRGNVKSELFAGYLKSFVDQLIRDFPTKRTIIYSNRFVIQDWIYKFGKFFLRNKPEKYPLMIAQYPYYGWNDALKGVISDPANWNPVLPAGITSWAFWQYSADGNRKGIENGIPARWYGHKPDVDLDVFNGNLTQLRAYLKKETAPEPIPELTLEQKVAHLQVWARTEGYQG